MGGEACEIVKQKMEIDAPPKGELPKWGNRIEFDGFFVELVPPGPRSFNVRLAASFASISFSADEGRSSLADDKLRRYERRPYEYIVTPPNFPLRGESTAAPEVLAIVFEYDAMRTTVASALQIPTERLEPRVIIGNPKPFITSLADRVRKHMLAHSQPDAYLHSLCTVLIAELLRLPPKQLATGRGTVLKDDVFRAMLSYIDSNLEADLSLETLAQLSGVGTHQFGRAFKRRVGKPPHHYVLNRRLDAARRLIQGTEQSIADIAYATGFSSQSHMTTTFRRELGTTPARLRHEASR